MANFILKQRRTERHTIEKNDKALGELMDIFATQISSRLRAGETGMKPLAPSSVQNYVHKLNRIALLANGKAWDGNPEFLLNFDNVKDKLEASSLDSKKDYISPIVKIMRFYNMDANVINKYQKLLSDFKQTETKKRGDNLASKKQEENSLPLDEINKRIDAYEPRDIEELVFKLLMVMYFQNSEYTPRLEDIALMKLVNAKKKTGDLNKDFNYITTTGDKGQIKVKDMLLNNYKTKTTYGSVRFPIPTNVGQIMNRYIREAGRVNGDYFLLNTKGEPYFTSTFSHLISRASQAVLGVNMTANLIRRIKISHFYNSGAKTINEEEAEAKKYLHGATVQREYLSVNLIDREEE